MKNKAPKVESVHEVELETPLNFVIYQPATIFRNCNILCTGQRAVEYSETLLLLSSCNVRTDSGSMLSARGKSVGKGSDVSRFLVRARGQLTPATKRLKSVAYFKTLMGIYNSILLEDYANSKNIIL